ncbi:hypothetical protein N9124_00295 [bacterium]|nr:hypothetical protein [Akkermansiaceae bacterium]MDA7536576.1 hypothetical protein [bacterium]MDA7538017.1 hypothetical protein [Akkermansiaceae bacterium]MDA7629453.1 hypothetical protein [Akkermansiaceae bacterium]MDA7674869.1 hypothetical protein [Akkermansiaceae bacterium]
MKKALIWLVVVILFIIGGSAFWMKLKIDEAPENIEDPGLNISEDLVIPDPE